MILFDAILHTSPTISMQFLTTNFEASIEKLFWRQTTFRTWRNGSAIQKKFSLSPALESEVLFEVVCVVTKTKSLPCCIMKLLNSLRTHAKVPYYDSNLKLLTNYLRALPIQIVLLIFGPQIYLLINFHKIKLNRIWQFVF